MEWNGWSPMQDRELLQSLKGHGDPVYTAIGSPRRHAHRDREQRPYGPGVEGADRNSRRAQGHGDKFTGDRRPSTATRIVTASLNQTAPEWEAQTETAELKGHGKEVVTATYSPDLGARAS